MIVTSSVVASRLLDGATVIVTSLFSAVFMLSVVMSVGIKVMRVSKRNSIAFKQSHKHDGIMEIVEEIRAN